MATDSVTQMQADYQRLLSVAERVRGESSEKGSYAIVREATEIVKECVDPTSAVGRIQVATLLDSIIWRMGNTHYKIKKFWSAIQILNPKRG